MFAYGTSAGIPDQRTLGNHASPPLSLSRLCGHRHLIRKFLILSPPSSPFALIMGKAAQQNKASFLGPGGLSFAPYPSNMHTLLAVDGLVHFFELYSLCCFSVPSTPLFSIPVLITALLDRCNSGRFPKGCVHQPGSLSGPGGGPDLQENMQATLLYAPTLYCCQARCWVLPSLGRGGPDQFPTLCGQQARPSRGLRPAPGPPGPKARSRARSPGRASGTGGAVHMALCTALSFSSRWPWAPGRTHP